jgi:hypothetical protein
MVELHALENDSEQFPALGADEHSVLRALNKDLGRSEIKSW